MRILLERHGKTPLYRQIEEYLRQSILAGTLPAHTRLPSARRLALDLDVSRITVESAYADLEADGLVARKMGSGTFVLPPGPRPPARSGGEIEWPQWQRELDAGDIRPLSRPPTTSLISFTGFGDARLFRIDEFYGAIRHVIRRDGSSCLEVQDVSGYPPLRESIAHILSSLGIETYVDNVLVTSGSQQALSLVTRLLLKPGDTVLVESPTYDGALRLFRTEGVRVIESPVDAWGMRTDRVESLLKQHRPKLIYTIPTFQNPSGACMSIPRRRELIALADRYNVPIVEDDFAGDLRYDGPAQPALKALDPGGRVIFIGTFSKLLMPGLRVGYLVAEGPAYSRLLQMKETSDLTTGTLIQRALQSYVTVGRYHAQLRRLCQHYRRRRDRMIQAISEYLPEVRVNVPQGGLFIWMRLPPGLEATRLLAVALQEGVEFTPGSRFFFKAEDGEAYARLNFAVATPEEIEEGMKRLGNAMRKVASDR